MQIFQGINSFDDVIKKVKENQNQILAILGLTVLIAASGFGYSYYKSRRESRAYRALVSAIEYFDAPIKKADEDINDVSFLGRKEFNSEKEKWEKVETLFDKEYNAHSSSGISQIFLVYRSHALLKLNRANDAVEVMQKAISVGNNADINDFLKVRLALILLDTKDEASAKKGLSVLTEMAHDGASSSNDLALYQLGEYYWHENNFDEAKNYWNQLLLKFGKREGDAVSPWVDAAKEKLRLIDADVD